MKTVEKIERKLPVLKTRKRVAAYARVSMESERMQHSLSAQVSYYSALIQKNPEWEYAGVFADYGISGTGTKKREEFNRMLAECEAGNIDIILTKSIQRFARNTVDLLNTVRHLKDLGIEVRFENVLFTHDDILMLVRLIYHLTQLCCLIINRQGVVIIIYRRQIIQIMLYPEESLKIAILSIPITTMNDSH